MLINDNKLLDNFYINNNGLVHYKKNNDNVSLSKRLLSTSIGSY